MTDLGGAASPRTLPEPAATIVRLTEKLQEDLAFAAPEMRGLMIERRLADAYAAGEAAQEAPSPEGLLLARLPNTEAATYIEDDPEAWKAWLLALRRYAPQLASLTAHLGSEDGALEVIGGSILAYLASEHDLGLLRFGGEAAHAEPPFVAPWTGETLNPDRAEARPPEGLDALPSVDDLAAALTVIYPESGFRRLNAVRLRAALAARLSAGGATKP